MRGFFSSSPPHHPTTLRALQHPRLIIRSHPRLPTLDASIHPPKEGVGKGGKKKETEYCGKGGGKGGGGKKLRESSFGENKIINSSATEGRRRQTSRREIDIHATVNVSNRKREAINYIINLIFKKEASSKTRK